MSWSEYRQEETKGCDRERSYDDERLYTGLVLGPIVNVRGRLKDVVLRYIIFKWMRAAKG